MSIFTSLLTKYPEVFTMLLGNSSGKIWMMGGGVVKILSDYFHNPNHTYRLDYWNLCSLGKFPFRDLDFIVEGLEENFWLAPSWEKKDNTFGGMKLIKSSPYRDKPIIIDIWQIYKHEPCLRNGLKPTIENVLRLSPLTTQAVAVDLREGRVLGEVGIRAIQNRTVGVYNKREMKHYCQIYNTTPDEILKKKADHYNFTPIFH